MTPPPRRPKRPRRTRRIPGGDGPRARRRGNLAFGERMVYADGVELNVLSSELAHAEPSSR